MKTAAGNTTLAGVNYGLARFYKDKEGVVHPAGAATVGKEGSSFLVKMFTLPTAFRPTNGIFEILPPGKELGVVVTGANASFEGVSENGAVLAPKEESVSLSGITSRAEG